MLLQCRDQLELIRTEDKQQFIHRGKRLVRMRRTPRGWYGLIFGKGLKIKNYYCCVFRFIKAMSLKRVLLLGSGRTCPPLVELLTRDGLANVTIGITCYD